MFPSISPSCDRCSQGPASLAHMFWNCPHITTYWNTTFQTLSKILKKQLKPDPIWALFGVKPVNVQLSDTKKQHGLFCDLVSTEIDSLVLETKNAPCSLSLNERYNGSFEIGEN